MLESKVHFFVVRINKIFGKKDSAVKKNCTGGKKCPYFLLKLKREKIFFWGGRFIDATLVGKSQRRLPTRQTTAKGILFFGDVFYFTFVPEVQPLVTLNPLKRRMKFLSSLPQI